MWILHSGDFLSSPGGLFSHSCSVLQKKKIREKEEDRRRVDQQTTYIPDWMLHNGSRTGGVHCLRGIVLFETGHSASLIITRPLEQLDLLQLYRTTSGIWYMYIHVSLLEEDAIQSLAAKTQIKYSTLYLRE